MIPIESNFHKVIYKRVSFSSKKNFKSFYIRQGYQHLKNLNQFSHVGSRNFENNQLPFVGSHKLGITLYFKITNYKLRLNNFLFDFLMTSLAF
jgi:hypothetical protein